MRAIKKIILLMCLFSLSMKGFSQAQDSSKAVLLIDSAWQACYKNHFKKSLRLIDSSIAIDSSHSWAYMIKAEAHWSIGEYYEAAIAYKKAMSLDNDFLLGAHVLLGILYEKAGLDNKAKQQYTYAISLWESSHQHTTRNKLLEEQVDYLEAIGLTGDSIKLKSKLNEIIEKDKTRKSHLDWLFNVTRYELLETISKRYWSADIIPIDD